MTNMKRTLSAIAAMAMLATSIGTMNAFADEDIPSQENTTETEDTTAIEPVTETIDFYSLGDQNETLTPTAKGINDPYLKTVNEHDEKAIE